MIPIKMFHQHLNLKTSKVNKLFYLSKLEESTRVTRAFPKMDFETKEKVWYIEMK